MMKFKNLQSKKGFWIDIPLIIISLFVIVVIIFFVHQAFTSIMPELDEKIDNPTSTDILNTGQNVINGFDMLLIFFMIGLAIALIASTFYLDTNPLFFALVILILIIMLVVGGILSTVFNTISSEDMMAGTTATFPLSSYVFNNFTIFILVYITIGVIAFYAKSRIT